MSVSLTPNVSIWFLLWPSFSQYLSLCLTISVSLALSTIVCLLTPFRFSVPLAPTPSVSLSIPDSLLLFLTLLPIPPPAAAAEGPNAAWLKPSATLLLLPAVAACFSCQQRRSYASRRMEAKGRRHAPADGHRSPLSQGNIYSDAEYINNFNVARSSVKLTQFYEWLTEKADHAFHLCSLNSNLDVYARWLTPYPGRE